MKSLFAGILMVWVLAVGCGPGGNAGDAGDAGRAMQEPITVLLSKQYGAGACENWLARNSEEVLVFINAYELDQANDYAALRHVLTQVDGMVLTGGPDIHPGRYQLEAETLRCETIDVHRDRIEEVMLDYVQESGLACLGLCRGLQYMNVHFGGTLHPHLPDTLGHLHRAGLTGDQKRAHTHGIEVTAALSSVALPVGTSGNMVSAHHQGIARLAPELEAWAVSPDGLREGVWHPDTAKYPFLVGVQWHPEYSDSTHVLSTALANGFLQVIQEALRP